MKKLVGKVTPQERDEIQTLFERRNGLTELAKILTVDDEQLYNRLVADLGENSTKFQNWWNVTSEKYGWESAEDSRWEIDFQSCQIFLVGE